MNFPTNSTTKKYYMLSNTSPRAVYDISVSKPQVEEGFVVRGYDTDTDDLLPRIKVYKEGNDVVYYYLDLYIQDGDTYDDSTSAFTKQYYKKNYGLSGETITGRTMELVSTSAYTDYLMYLCREQIKQNILDYPYYTFNDFNLNKSLLGVPEYVISGNGYSVSGTNCTGCDYTNVELIEFTPETYDELKKTAMYDVIYEQSSNIASKYNCKISGLTLTEI